MGAWAIIAALFLAVAAPAAAQDVGRGLVTLNQDRLFSASAYGRRVAAILEAATAELAAENREIEAELIAEERRLTEDRAGMEPEAFGVLADAFDDRVEGIRARQAAKERRLTQAADLARQRFIELAVPVLLDLLEERGGAVVVDSRAVILAPDGVDITDAAIARIDAQIGEADATGILDAVPLPQEEPVSPAD